MNKIIKNKFRNLNIITYLFFAYILIILAGFRPLEYFQDTVGYIEWIHTNDKVFQLEPTFWIINQFNQLLLGGEDQIFFLIYAILGVSIKVLAIRRLSAFPFLSLYLYICLYFILHEMTQIRVGVACGIFLLAIPDILNKNFKKYLLKTIIATSFHYSALIMIFLYFIDSKKIDKKTYYLLPLLGLIFAYVPNLFINIFNLISMFLPSFLSVKVIYYIDQMDKAEYNSINIFNIFILSLIIIYYYFLFNLDFIKTKLNILLIKLLGIQLFVYFLFSSVPPIAVRVSDFIGISIIITIPNLIFLFKQKKFPILIIVIWGGLYLWFIGINRLINF